MKKLYFLLLFVLLFQDVAIAQKLSVESFHLAPTDITAQTEGRKDLNGDACALVKISFVGDVIDIEGNVIKPLVKRNNETWAFMTQESRQMKVVTKDYLPLMVTIGDYGIEKLQGNRTYVLTLAKLSGASETLQMQTLTIKYSPITASVLVDNKFIKGSNGVAKTSLPIGQHSYIIACDGYESEEGMVKLKPTAPSNLQITLSEEMASASQPALSAASVINSDELDVLGGIFCPITAAKKEQLGIKYGVEVIKVNKGVLRDVGISCGFIIQKINDTNITSFDDLLEAVKTASTFKDPVLYIQGMGSTGKKNYFAIPLQKDKVIAIQSTLSQKIQEQQSVGQMQSAPSIVSSPTSNTSSNYDGNSSASIVTIPVKDGITIELVKVEAGSFDMGATHETKKLNKDEKPVHRVTLTNNYYIGKYEVTQSLWQAVMGRNPSKFVGENLPVENVSWNDCQEFISKLNRLTGKQFRLPTEAEWEFAARGGKMSRGYQFSGSNILTNVAWYKKNSKSKTHVVGTKLPNELGIYDMSGNVYEWCQDWKGAYGSSPQTNPCGPENGLYRIYRGGSWNDGFDECRLSSRGCISSGYTDDDRGLRLALSE